MSMAVRQTVVQKFGGAAVASPDMIQQTARHVAHAVEQGKAVAVVVSAMQGVTDQLASYVSALSLVASPGERDTVLAAGEQITCGLMALALQNLGLKASSWLSWQVPITAHTPQTGAREGRIACLETEKISAYMAEGGIPVIAGFQGVTPQDRLITFGRGGSDITAVALAARLRALSCDFYKDVPGIMTADPALVPDARVIQRLSISEMLELSALGAKVLQARAVELAAKEGVPVRVLPCFVQGAGTHLYHTNEENFVENPLVRSLVCQSRQSQLFVHLSKKERDQTCVALIEVLQKAHIAFDMLTIVPQEETSSETVLFALSGADQERAATLFQSQLGLKGDQLHKKSRLAKLSMVGVGLQGHSQILATLFKVLSDHTIPVLGTCTSQCRITLLVEEAFAELALRVLHTTFLPETEEENINAIRTVHS